MNDSNQIHALVKLYPSFSLGRRADFSLLVNEGPDDEVLKLGKTERKTQPQARAGPTRIKEQLSVSQ